MAKDKAIDGFRLILEIKQAAIDGWLDNPISEITGCGVCVVIDELDALLKDWLDLKNRCAELENQMKFYRQTEQEWRELGFDYDPSEYKDEQQEALRALAQRFNDEVDERCDAEELQEIEARKAERESRKREARENGNPCGD